MPLQIQGNGGTVAEVDGTTFRAQRATPRPTDYGSLGSFSLTQTTGSIGAALAAGSEILQFRWADSTRLAVITEVSIEGIYASTAFTAGVGALSMQVARSWSASGSGGTAATLSGSNQKLRTSMGTSLFNTSGDLRVATTAALGVGTKTLDSTFLGRSLFHTAGGPGSATPIIGPLFLHRTDLFKADVASGEHPLVLAQNEGFVVVATVPATGVWQTAFRIKWHEVAAF